MNWNPSPEVNVAREASKKLGDAPMCIIIWRTNDNRIGMASYGKTKRLCTAAGKIGEHLFNYVMKLLESE